MNRRGSRPYQRYRSLLLCLLLSVVAVGNVRAQEAPQHHAVITPTPLGPAIPPEITRYAANWPTAQHDLNGTRAATNSPINATNVASLEVAWTFPIEAVSGYGGMTATPLVAGGTVYVQDMQSNVFALDRETGAVRWHRTYNVPSIGPNGLALAYGMIFGATGDTAEVFALDAATGDERWRVRLTNHPYEGIDMAPAVYDSTVYISTIAGNTRGFNQGGTRGVLYALEAATGATLWSFDTTTDNLWGNPRINSGGGLWYPPSFDQDSNLYFGVGNAAPWAGTSAFPNGSSRPGNNDFASSMVSLDPTTGAVRWWQNAAPHDLFDHDFQNTPILATVSIDGQLIDLAIGSGKTGTLLAGKQPNGEIIWETAVGRHSQQPTSELPTTGFVEIMPGAWGGIVAPIAYVEGLLLVPIVDFPTQYSSTGYDQASMFDFRHATGQLVAVDAATGHIVWSQALPTPAFVGATVAGNVVFTGGLDGVLRAFDVFTGTVLGSFQTTSGLNAPLAVDGEMVFVPAAGPRFVLDNADPHEDNSDVINQLIAYRLSAQDSTPGANE